MVCVIKYNAGNTRSVLCALERLGVEAVLSDDKETILKADKVIFPGVGAAASAFAFLQEKGLDEIILQVEKPFLGICLGMQLMCSSSKEGDVKTLGIFKDLEVVKFKQNGIYKIPHMGWNTIEKKDSPLLGNIKNDEYFYFVHSYYVPFSEKYTIAATEYCNTKFSSIINYKNFYGTQFHPEKSGSEGEKILLNFLNLGDK